MVHIQESAEFAATAEAVWKIAGDFHGFVEALGGEATSEGEGVGNLRRIAGPRGDLVERLEALDNDSRSLTYAVIDPSPLPVKNYAGKIHVTAVGTDRARMDWEATFEPADDVPEEKAVRVVSRTFQGGLGALGKLVEG